ncbi:hypothetical protein [Verrucomicrobium sp. 3C]|uniref:hypothetical protein n=1 Tax=Verrucomicrobium sp. 3C TaxID=1134055 RepID=UPI0003808336|nr:hypothetical protein [Verrucomicrobium sp. 3C]
MKKTRQIFAVLIVCFAFFAGYYATDYIQVPGRKSQKADTKKESGQTETASGKSMEKTEQLPASSPPAKLSATASPITQAVDPKKEAKMLEEELQQIPGWKAFAARRIEAINRRIEELSTARHKERDIMVQVPMINGAFELPAERDRQQYILAGADDLAKVDRALLDLDAVSDPTSSTDARSKAENLRSQRNVILRKMGIIQ